MDASSEQHGLRELETERLVPSCRAKEAVEEIGKHRRSSVTFINKSFNFRLWKSTESGVVSLHTLFNALRHECRWIRSCSSGRNMRSSIGYPENGNVEQFSLFGRRFIFPRLGIFLRF